MRPRKKRLSDPVVGLITLAVISVAVFAIYSGIPTPGGKFEVKAVLRNAPEVQPGSKVRIAGVNVGTVTGTERGKGTLAVIKLEIEDSALPLHEDATLKLRPRTFLEGGFFVDLRPGTPGSPEMERGYTIPLANTSTPVLLGHATADLRLATRENLRRLFHAVRLAVEGDAPRALRDAQQYIAPAFRGVAQVSEAAQGEEQGDLSGAVEGSAGTMAALASRDEQLAQLLTGLNRTVRALGRRRLEVGRSLEELDPLLAEARPVLADLNEIFPTARAFAAELRPSIRRAPTALRLALPLLDQADALLRPRELPALLRQADPAFRALARQEPYLARVLELTRPVISCLQRNAYPVLLAKLDDPPHSTGEPVYRELLHGLPAVTSVAQNFDGNGPAVRYHAGFGERTLSTNLPGSGEPVVGLTSEVPLGSRPRYTGTVPPFRPRTSCLTQDPPNLRADTGPAPSASFADRGALRRRLMRLADLVQRRGR